MDTLKVSAILCHHKGNLIDKAVESLQKSRDVELEIIIASSDQACVDFYQNKPGVIAIYCEGGPAYKRNIAFKFAQHNLIAFFDDDIEVTLYAVSEMAKTLQQDKVGLVFGKLLNMEFHDLFDEAGSFLTWSGFLWARAESGCKDYGQFDKVEPVLAGKSASCMIHRRVFSEAGMYDPSYEILGEETDLSWRVWLLGYNVLFVPSSVTYHAFNTRFKPQDFYIPRRVYFNGCRNYITMLLTNLETHNLVVPIITQVLVWFMASMGMLITGKREAGFYILKGLWYVVNNLRRILHKRSLVQSKRKVSDAELFKTVKRNPPISYYTNRFFHYIKTGRHG